GPSCRLWVGRAGANIWAGRCPVLRVAWVQFPLIRALLSTSAGAATGNGGNPQNLEKSEDCSKRNYRLLLRPTCGVGGGENLPEERAPIGPTVAARKKRRRSRFYSRFPPDFAFRFVARGDFAAHVFRKLVSYRQGERL